MIYLKLDNVAVFSLGSTGSSQFLHGVSDILRINFSVSAGQGLEDGFVKEDILVLLNDGELKRKFNLYKYGSKSQHPRMGEGGRTFRTFH